MQVVNKSIQLSLQRTDIQSYATLHLRHANNLLRLFTLESELTVENAFVYKFNDAELETDESKFADRIGMDVYSFVAERIK